MAGDGNTSNDDLSKIKKSGPVPEKDRENVADQILFLESHNYPRCHFQEYLTNFQAKEEFDIGVLIGESLTPEEEKKLEKHLLSELHGIIVHDHDIWSPDAIQPWMVKDALKTLGARQLDRVYQEKSPFGQFEFGLAKHDHLMTLWSKLSERQPLSLTPSQERFIMSTYDLIHGEAKKQGVQFSEAYLLLKICDILDNKNPGLEYLRVYQSCLLAHKASWAERYDNKMRKVFEALRHKWSPTPRCI